jgi:radical SAM protein with 4Fe4S-binding SPASM domain
MNIILPRDNGPVVYKVPFAGELGQTDIDRGSYPLRVDVYPRGRLLGTPRGARLVSWRDVVKKTQNENILFSVLIELTFRCNLDCTFCYNDVDQKGTALTKEDYFRFFEDLRDMQVMNLAFSGGEPLAHPDFIALGAKARELGFVIRIKSNGHAIRAELARRIKEEIDPFNIEVSLHGARAETHDRQTRVPGSFEQLMANVREMKKVGLRTKFNTVLTRWNESDLEDMFTLADAKGVELLIDPEVTPRDNGDQRPLDLAASDEGLRRLYRLQSARMKSAGKNAKQEVQRLSDEDMPVPEDKQCGAGSSGITVDPFGNVYPCVQWRRPLGNLHESSIKDIWKTSEALEGIRTLTVEAKRFVDNRKDELPLLRYCIGCALLCKGNPLMIYPAAEKNSRIYNEVQKEEQ